MVKRVLRAIWAFMQKVWALVGPSQSGWTGAALALFFLGTASLLWQFYYNVIEDYWPGRLLAFGVYLTLILGMTLAVQIQYGLFRILPTRFRFAFAYAFFSMLLFAMAIWGPPNGFLPVAGLVVLLSLVAGAVWGLAKGRDPFWRKLKGAVVALLSLGGLGYAGWLALSPQDNPNPWAEGLVFQDGPPIAADPSVPGPYSVEALTYGSGKDLHRAEFAEGADFETKPVDGSSFVDRWSGPVGKARTDFWGFDAKELPLQGRIWMPQGAGPFPLILMVHGNHAMEDFSDPGYEYLGRHFASRGIIAVSVDENFLNSSMVDLVNPMESGIGPENDARGWLLLKHLEQWRAWNGQDGHPMHGKVDMDHLALMGHSRGGEAVAVAAAFNSLKASPDNANEVFDFGFNLSGIIAIAPIDGQYSPRRGTTKFEDINYLTIHGSMDGDVQSFEGSAQMARISFSGTKERFKASFYIEGANHGQFNTVWGRKDYGMPMSALLDLRPIMPPDEQRQIALVVFTAFLEAVFNGKDEALAVLEDPRRAGASLPDRYMIANLIRSDRQMLADFEEDMDPTTATREGASLIGTHLTKWREETPRLKWGSLYSNVAIVAWDSEVEEETASYTLVLHEALNGEEKELVFSLSHMGTATKPKDWEKPEAEDGEDEEAPQEETEADKDEGPAPLDWTLVAVDAAGVQARFLLSADAPLYPQVKANTRRLSSLEGTAKSELVWRRYAFPLSSFRAANPSFDPGALKEIRFEFDQSESGIIALDDLGLEDAR